MSKNFGDILKQYYGEDEDFKESKSSNFAEILDSWENKNKIKSKKSKTNNSKSQKKYKTEAIPQIDMSTLIDQYPVIDKDSEYENGVLSKKDKEYTQKQLDKMLPQDEIDLHGLTALEAQIALNNFFTKSQARKLKKVSIVHGKGKHSKEGPILKHLVQHYLEGHKFAGKTSHPKESEGGSGTTWVILKY